MMKIVWIIPLFPLISFIAILLFQKKLKNNSAFVGIAMTALSFIFSTVALISSLSGNTYKLEKVWLTMGQVNLTAGFEVNQLNVLMLFIVSLVSMLIHIYSMGYMRGDERFPIYYAYLGLFTFAMLGLVVSPNLLQTYIFWELVGLGSFLLIGFYFYKDEARKAAKKAFIMTRIGDVALLVGMILLFWQVGSIEYAQIFSAISDGVISEGMITLTAILIFIGAIGKSGQFPLHTWLPDAMEGPTPVSALIHAATMVAAGVYLVAALFPLFVASKTALLTVAVVGAFTAIFAASIGIVQADIKRVLAYSTVSQLGFMMLALGSAGYVAGVFHLTTHAFFKALLFLAAGSVIHAVGTQNIEKMGGLWRKLSITGPVFLIGTLAISGVPLLSGFFSKDEILVAAWVQGHYLLFLLALIAAFMTAFYMFRLFFLVFIRKGEESDQKNVLESPKSMTVPMIVLAFLAIFAGYVNTPWFGTFLGDWLTSGREGLGPAYISGPMWIMLLTTVVSLTAIYLAYLIYVKESISRQSLMARYKVIYNILLNKYYVDEFYEATIIKLTDGFSSMLRVIDEFIVEGIIKLITSTVKGLGMIGSKFQNGQVQLYGTVAFVGLALILVIFAMTGGYFG